MIKSIAQIILIMTILGHFSLFAKPPLSDLDKLFQTSANSKTVPGLSVAIADSSGITYAKGFGFADLENQLPMSPTTKLRIGSVSKVLATGALMRMVEEGSVDLSRNVEDLVSAWPKSHEDINFYHLTGHTSGIRHYGSSSEFLSNKQYNSRIESLSIFKDDPLRFKPGNRFSYSTYAWTLIAAAMEQADGKRDFNQLMIDYVFDPLKLTNTLLETNSKPIKNMQKPYTVSNGELTQSRQVNNSYKYAGGGILSTPSDVVTFAMAHTEQSFLKPDTLKLMFTNQKFNDGNKNRYGIGWRVGFEEVKANMNRDSEQNKELIKIVDNHPNSVFHSGGSIGASTMLILCLDHKHAVAMVKNVDGDRSTNLMNLSLQALDMSWNG